MTTPPIAAAALLVMGTVLCPTAPVASVALPRDQSDTSQAEPDPAGDKR